MSKFRKQLLVGYTWHTFLGIPLHLCILSVPALYRENMSIITGVHCWVSRTLEQLAFEVPTCLFMSSRGVVCFLFSLIIIQPSGGLNNSAYIYEEIVLFLFLLTIFIFTLPSHEEPRRPTLRLILDVLLNFVPFSCLLSFPSTNFLREVNLQEVYCP